MIIKPCDTFYFMQGFLYMEKVVGIKVVGKKWNEGFKGFFN